MKKIVVLSGAGISAESGISTFREIRGTCRDINIRCSLRDKHDQKTDGHDSNRNRYHYQEDPVDQALHSYSSPKININNNNTNIQISIYKLNAERKIKDLPETVNKAIVLYFKQLH